MWDREGVGQGGGGTGRGYPPSPDRSKMEIRKCLDDLLSTLKSVFCKAILYINIDNTHFELHNCKKIGTHCSRHEVPSGEVEHFLRSPCMRHEVPSVGGTGMGVSPLPR